MFPHSSTALLYQGVSGFAPALKSVASFAGETQLSTWLYRIVINLALRQLFSQRKRILHGTRQALRPVFRMGLASAAKWAPSRSHWHLPVGVVVTGVVVLSLGVGRDALARPIEEQICNASADYSLGIEDYAEAIRLHQEVVRQHPDNALAHYHLGFAEGMMGRRTAEISEYQRAEALGLGSWDLFLNLGLAQFEEGELDGAAASLRRAVLLGEDHFESHFNLALVDERRGMLAEAERETLAALRLNPRQTEALNLQGVIYAREGETVRASRIFQEVIREQPDYEPARANLLMLDGPNGSVAAETPGGDPPAPGIDAGAAKDQSRPLATGLRNVTATKSEP
jgi:tetratricopeptide (TPR) repeat protein